MALGRILDGIAGVTTYEELGDDVLPALGGWLGCGGWNLNRSTSDELCVTVRTNLQVVRDYRRHWFDKDPLNTTLLAPRPDPILPVSRLPEWSSRLARHPLYSDFRPTHGISHLLWTNLSDVPYLRPGSTTIMFFREVGDRDFDGDDVLAMAQVLPALRVAERRCARAARAQKVAPALEALLESTAPGAHLLFSAAGELVWVSAEASRLLASRLGRRKRLPETPPGAPRPGTAVTRFVLDGGVRVRAERRPVGDAFTLIKLSPDDGDSTSAAASV